MIKLSLVFQSLLNRWLSCLLIILTLAFSISLFFTVSRIQETVKSSFQNTVSGVDSSKISLINNIATDNVSEVMGV